MHQIFVDISMNDIQRRPDDCLNWPKMALPQDLEFFYINIIIIRKSKKILKWQLFTRACKRIFRTFAVGIDRSILGTSSRNLSGMTTAACNIC